MKHSPATIFVSLQAPHRISAYSFNDEVLLGYSMELLRGRSIKIFHGPKTEITKLTAAIKNSALNTPVSVELDLYDRDGICHRVAVACTPFCGAGGAPVACRISIQLDTETQVVDNGSSDSDHSESDRTNVLLPSLTRDRGIIQLELPLSLLKSHPSRVERTPINPLSLPALWREPVPSPYIRRPAPSMIPGQELAAPPSMKAIVWKRISPLSR